MLVGLGSLLLLWWARVAVAAEFQVTSHWMGGFQASVTIPICQEMDGWRVHIVFDDDIDSIEVGMRVKRRRKRE